VRLCETPQPAAGHWRFVTVFERDRAVVDGKVGWSAVAFFLWLGVRDNWI